MSTAGEDDYHNTQHETLTRLLKELRIPAEVRVKTLWLLLSSLRLASIEFSSTKIIVITLANHKELKQCSEPIKKSR